jgi:hypothetical protein
MFPQDHNEISDLLVNKGGYVYICGPSRGVPFAVEQAIADAFVKVSASRRRCDDVDRCASGRLSTSSYSPPGTEFTQTPTARVRTRLGRARERKRATGRCNRMQLQHCVHFCICVRSYLLTAPVQAGKFDKKEAALAYIQQMRIAGRYNLEAWS